MNERLKELAEQSYEEVPHEREWDSTTRVFNKEKFAQLIIAECTAQPRVYLLFHKSAMEYDAPDVLHGWTSDLRIAQQWRDSSPRSCGAHRRFENISFVNKVDTL
jgi:fermentation-respiration switch protein FrsA (DUF1100 family)